MTGIGAQHLAGDVDERRDDGLLRPGQGDYDVGEYYTPSWNADGAKMKWNGSTRLSLADPSRSRPLTPGRGIAAYLTFFVH